MRTGFRGEEVVREALAKQVRYDRKDPSDFSGMLAEENPHGDGLEYQDKVRSEWER